jgi:hypothetical protein
MPLQLPLCWASVSSPPLEEPIVLAFATGFFLPPPSGHLFITKSSIIHIERVTQGSNKFKIIADAIVGIYQ